MEFEEEALMYKLILLRIWNEENETERWRKRKCVPRNRLKSIIGNAYWWENEAVVAKGRQVQSECGRNRSKMRRKPCEKRGTNGIVCSCVANQAVSCRGLRELVGFVSKRFVGITIVDGCRHFEASRGRLTDASKCKEKKFCFVLAPTSTTRHCEGLTGN